MFPTLRGIYLPEIHKYEKGKVRENYSLDDGKRLIITTDRQSAFDRIISEIPYKGQVLNLLAAWWFEKTKDIVPNHMIEVLSPNSVLVKNLKPIPVEVVIRGYISGVTTTSAWYAYERGDREYCGHILPEGLQKNMAFENPIITPTTKASHGHDEKISRKEILEQGLVSEDKWNQIEEYAQALFARGQQIAKEHGLILVDTKYEFGEDENGTIFVMDEIHTPDSSRFWNADTYEERFNAGLEPENIDKEFLRLWLRDKGFMGDGELPEIPNELIERFSNLYISVFEQLTGERFVKSSVDIETNIVDILKSKNLLKGNFVQIIMGSESDMEFAERMITPLREMEIPTGVLIASAHKTPEKVLSRVKELNHSSEPVIYITIAGRSNALSAVVAANSVHPVIACPPHKDKSDYLVNIHSTLQSPSKTPVLTVVDPSNVIDAILRIFGLSNASYRHVICREIKTRKEENK